MACTLKELQDTEYEILCKFADFCESRNISYVLAGGTLLGAIRHNGFIPWDDDIDVSMTPENFKKFLRCIRRHPIPGFHLSWIDTEPEYPFFYAKLRKNGTFMPEDDTKPFDMHNGVWLDIFIDTGIPKSDRLDQFQKRLFYIFKSAARLNIDNPIGTNSAQQNLKLRLLQRLSRKNMCRLRKILFSLYTGIGNRRSETVMRNDWILNPRSSVPRLIVEPTCKHVFRDREFLIPQDYDQALTLLYGDYMTPVKKNPHTRINEIQL